MFAAKYLKKDLFVQRLHCKFNVESIWSSGL